MTYSARALLVAAALVAVSPGSASAGGWISAGAFASEWRMGDSRGHAEVYEARLDLSAGLAFGLSFCDVTMPDTMVPAEGFAIPPDVRGSIFITPVPNRYFAPFLSLGAGRARYADDRLVMIGGVGVETELGRFLVFQAEWVVIEPEPVGAAEIIVERKKQELLVGTNRPLGDLVGEHFNLATSQARIGLRLTY